jgi:hypothetical protein
VKYSDNFVEKKADVSEEVLFWGGKVKSICSEIWFCLGDESGVDGRVLDESLLSRWVLRVFVEFKAHSSVASPQSTQANPAKQGE